MGEEECVVYLKILKSFKYNWLFSIILIISDRENLKGGQLNIIKIYIVVAPFIFFEFEFDLFLSM